MWSVINSTPFESTSGWLIDPTGVDLWTLAIKVTMDISAAGVVTLAAEQTPVLDLAEFRRKPEASSLRYDAELTLPRGGTDVVLDASAYAPNGQPATSVAVDLAIGNAHKSLKVHGPRMWTRGILGVSPSSPEPFISLPLTYEQALGGMRYSETNELLDGSMENPVGVGYGTLKRVGLPAPAITYPGEEDNPKRLAGYGPVASHWSPRRELYGTVDATWSTTRAPLMPLDYSPAAERCAPADQQLPVYLNEPVLIRLSNLTPSGSLAFRLTVPKINVTVLVGREKQSASAKLTLLIIEPDKSGLSMVFQHWLPAPDGQESIGTTWIEGSDE